MDVAEIYGVGTKRLIEHINSNISGFFKEFMFQLTQQEFNVLTWQIASLKTELENRLLCFYGTGCLPMDVVTSLSDKTPLWDEVEAMYHPTKERLKVQNYWIDCQPNK